MAEFTPEANNEIAVESSTASKERVIKMPQIGDTMKVVVDKWGGFYIPTGDYNSAQDGSKVLEVEVKALKVAKIIYQDAA